MFCARRRGVLVTGPRLIPSGVRIARHYNWVVNADENIGLFDLDGSLADFNGQLLADLEMLRSPDEERVTDLYAA